MTSKAQRLAEDVIGSPSNIHDRLLNMTIEECQEFDTLATICKACKWWAEADDVNEEHICTDCEK